MALAAGVHLLALATCAPPAPGPTDAPAFPVLDGARQAVIVHPADATAEAEQAYRDLAAYLERASGRPFRVVAEEAFDAADDAFPIYVGACRTLPDEDREELARLDRDAYLVHVTPTAALLAGPRPWSTYWAVCQFLEDHVGVRWLIPGELGEDVPHRERLVVAPQRRTFAPVVLSRQWSGAQYGGAWGLRQRIHGRYRFHHNLLRVFDAQAYYDENPEWYPLRNGQRYRPGRDDHSWQPCFGSESSVRQAAEAARAAWAADPDLESFSYGCNDGQGWCECDLCRAMDRPMEPWDGFEGTYSHRYFGWLNRVAADLEATDPDRLLGCLAYSTYILPPEQIGLHRNIIPYLTSNRADYRDPAFRQRDQALLEWWGRTAHQVGIYDYAYGMGFAIPRIYTHLFQQAIRHAVAHRVTAFYAEVYPNWGLDGPKLYLMARVLWDPEVDVDALAAEWNQRMFRDAAEPMQRFFARCERAWEEQETGAGHWAYRLAGDPRQFAIFPPVVLAECTGYLDEAAALAPDDLVARRVHFFRKTWDVTLALAGQYWAAADVQERIDAGAPVDEVAAALRRMARQVATADVNRLMEEKVGDDPVAFHPPRQSWIAPLKGGAKANAERWTAAHLAGEEVERARTSGKLAAGDLRARIARRVEAVLGTDDEEAYGQLVGRVRAMAQKVAPAVRVGTPPAIDGVLDDDCWIQGDAMTGFTRWGESAPATHETRARLAHDGEHLYVALDCPQDTSGLRAEAAPRDGSAWRDDSVELFINPELSEFPFVQFIVNARGAFFDQWGQHAEETYEQRIGHDFGAEWATRVAADGWTAELCLPLAEFGCSPADEPLLRVDLVRNVQGRQPEISAWFPSVGAHADPLSRGWVVMGESAMGRPGGYPDPARFDDAIAAFGTEDRAAAPPAGAIACVGSSSMRGWHRTIQRDLAPLTVIPRGFGGSTMYDALHYVDRVVVPYRPRAVLLYEGDNDIAAGVAPEIVFDTFRAWVARVHASVPETRIYFLSIKPSLSRWSLWPRMRRANELIARECERDDRLTYVDVATPMLGEDGTPRGDIFVGDRLHMNAQGYEIWTRAVRPVLLGGELRHEEGGSAPQ